MTHPHHADAPDPARAAALQALGLEGMADDACVDALLARLALARAEAAHDELTGVWQQGAIVGQLEQALARTVRDGRPLGVMKLRAHYLGDRQDPAGDPVGSQVLRAVTARLRDTLRGGDAIGRTGITEFLCLLEGCGIEAARLVAERCRLAVSQLPVPLQHHGASLTLVNASVALVMVHPNAEVPADGILEQADRLLEQVLGADRPVAVHLLAPA